MLLILDLKIQFRISLLLDFSPADNFLFKIPSEVFEYRMHR